MNKIGLIFLFFLIGLNSSFVFALSEPRSLLSLKEKSDKLILTNQSSENIALSRAKISFSFSGRIKISSALPFQLDRLESKLPHAAAKKYLLNFQNSSLELLPGQSLDFHLMKDSKHSLLQLSVILDDPIPVPVKVTSMNQNYVETISICNQTSHPIPLHQVSLQFHLNAQMANNIWGQPWTAWKLTSQVNDLVTLTGGTPWTPDLNPDPNCTNPMTIQFNASPNTVVSGPYVFSAVGAIPEGTGNLIIALPNAPAANLPNPKINLVGMNVNTSQVVNWNSTWKITSLVPGNYTISAGPINNGNQYFVFSPKIVNVQNGTTVTQNVQYQLIPTSPVTVTLINPPLSMIPVTLTGTNYTLKQSISNGTILNLPTDTYTVTSYVSGYSATISPNPLVVPANINLSISYQPSVRNPLIVGYFQSWDGDSETSDGTKTNLANLPSYLNVANLSFMRPDANYVKGSLSLNGTGLEFNYDGSVLKTAIYALHQRHPRTKVLVSVGGATYTNWNAFNPKSIADFVTDFGLDGVDIDFEPSNAGCALGTDQLMHCQIDTAFQSYIAGIRSLLPRPYWLTIATFSVGAFGQDQWKNSQPASSYTGMSLALLRSVYAKDIDMLNVMSYDAGMSYNPLEALAAYANYFQGTISMGIEVPPEDWGGHVYTLCQVNQISNAVKLMANQRNAAAAMMFWSIQKQVNGLPSPTNPSAQMIATALCTNLGLNDCNQPLLIH